MKPNKLHQQGFSLIELMVATLISLLISYAVLEIYLAQSQLSRASNSQAVIQSTQNAIIHMVTPIIRSTGFMGCGTLINAISNLNAGGPSPIGTINTNPIMIIGYSGGGSSFTITQNNPANDGNASDWTPSLEPTLAGNVQQGNDVLIVLSPVPGSSPVAITTIAPSSNFLVVQSAPTPAVTAGQFGVVSDCAKTVVFQITGIAGTNISHNAGGGTLENSSSTFPVGFTAGSQFIQLQQTAFFVGQGPGGQSALMRAILVGNNWTIQPIVPGIEFMKVQYGIGSGGNINQYVSANAVPNWGQVYAVRIGFLIQGEVGSGTRSSNQFRVLDTQVTVPADNRIRHVFEITIHLRNALS